MRASQWIAALSLSLGACVGDCGGFGFDFQLDAATTCDKPFGWEGDCVDGSMCSCVFGCDWSPSPFCVDAGADAYPAFDVRNSETTGDVDADAHADVGETDDAGVEAGASDASIADTEISDGDADEVETD